MIKYCFSYITPFIMLGYFIAELIQLSIVFRPTCNSYSLANHCNIKTYLGPAENGTNWNGSIVFRLSGWNLSGLNCWGSSQRCGLWWSKNNWIVNLVPGHKVWKYSFVFWLSNLWKKYSIYYLTLMAADTNKTALKKWSATFQISLILVSI